MRLKTFFAFSILVLILTIGAVSANENITDIAQSSDNDILENAVEGNTFADIQKAVNNAKANDVIELNGTYTTSGSEIKINKNLVFEGVNNATLDGKKVSGIFKTSCENYIITLKNINFINAKNNVFADEDHYNSKGKLIIDNCNFTDNMGGEYGAINCCNCIVTNSNFKNNSAKGFDDGADVVSWAGAISASNCSVTNCLFEKNSALNEGGAINSYYIYADNCNFIGNTARYSGGAIEGREITVKNSNFTSNSVTKGSGGAICGDGRIENCNFNKNTATHRAGAIDGSVTVINSIFTENTANYAGAIHSSFEGVEIVNSIFQSNSEAAVISNGITVKNPNKKFKGETILDNNLNSITLIKVSVKKLSTSYRSGKTLQIKLTMAISKKPAKNLGVSVMVYKGKKLFDAWKYTDEFISTNSKGIAIFKASKLPVGKYTIKIMEGYRDNDDDFFTCPFPVTKTTIKVTKAKTIIKAPKVTAKYKKANYFKLTVKNKATKKPINKLKLKVKVYTGKKYYKTYNLKTNKKGVAKLNTKNLSRGTHNVAISTKNTNYKLSANSKIKIK